LVLPLLKPFNVFAAVTGAVTGAGRKDGDGAAPKLVLEVDELDGNAPPKRFVGLPFGPPKEIAAGAGAGAGADADADAGGAGVGADAVTGAVAGAPGGDEVTPMLKGDGDLIGVILPKLGTDGVAA